MRKLDKNLSNNAAKEFSEDIKGESAQRLLSLLEEVLSEEMDKSYKESESKVLYDKPCWPERQADANGYRRCLRDVLQTIKPFLRTSNDR
jgi:hypothetical protein